MHKNQRNNEEKIKEGHLYRDRGEKKKRQKDMSGKNMLQDASSCEVVQNAKGENKANVKGRESLRRN